MTETIRNFIGGDWRDAAGGGWLENFEPATGLAYSRIPDSDERDVALAVRAAENALDTWRSVPAVARARVLRRVAGLIDKRKSILAQAETRDSGKPLSTSMLVDIPRASQNFEFFADAITQFSSEAHLTDEQAVNYTVRSPLGVVGCISPWNLPLYLFSWKIAPALAAGNCVVAKPSEVTPMTAHLLTEICAEAGVPPGVLNVVHGLGAKVGDAMSRHPGIGAISFTGSTATGARISSVAGPLFKKLSLEMGGKNPNVVFADCDFDQAVSETLRAAFSNQGQICLCGSRILIERKIYDQFRDALVARVKKLKVGDPLDEKTDQGAVVSKQHFDKVMGCIDLARREGGKVLVGGAAATVGGRCKGGWFIEPTLVEGLGRECATNQEEIFGPVASLMPFDNEKEALELANSTRYGLAATLWTRDVTRAHRFSAQLRSGIVWVNCWMLRDLRTPFGGVKDSGVGREGGLDALKFFTDSKNVCIRIQ